MALHWLRDWMKQSSKASRNPRRSARRQRRCPLAPERLEDRTTPSLIYNGGFETGNFSGWTQSGNLRFTSVSTINAHSGSYAAQLGPLSSGGFGYLGQSVSTVTNQPYVLSFWLEDGGGTDNEFEASWNTGILSSQTLLNTNFAPTGYHQYSYNVTGDSLGSGLTFAFYNNPSYFYLDDVSLLAVPTVNVSDLSGAYNGNPFTASASVSAVGISPSSSLEGVGLTYIYNRWNGLIYAPYSVNSAPTAPGSYQVEAIFPGSADYTSAYNFAYFYILPANPTVTVSDPGGTYNGGSFPATATVAGVNGQAASTLEGVGLTYNYYQWNGSNYAFIGGNAPSAAGSYEVQAYFPGSTDYTSWSSYAFFTINKATPTINWSNPADITYGTALSLTQLDATANVPGTFSYSPAAGAVLGTGLNQSLSTTFTPTDTADYNTVGKSVLINVNGAATTTAISAPTVNYNADGLVTVTVAAPNGVPAPTGAVSLTVDSTAFTYTLVAADNGAHTFDVGVQNAGSHSLNASYAAQGNYAGSGATGSLTVNQAPTTLSISAPTVNYGADGVITVTVSPQQGGVPTVTGTVSLFLLDDGSTRTATLDANGQATFTLTTPSAGSHGLTARYAAQGNYGSSSNGDALYVNQAPTSIAISAPDVTYNSNGSVTVTVSSAVGTPTGNVSLSVDNGPAVSQALTNGSSTFTINSPPAGNHSLSATYDRQGNFAGSGASGILHVNAAPTSVSISAPQITYNANGSITVTVSAAAGVPTPTGSVTLLVDGGNAQTLTLVNGAATFTVASPSVGDHSLSAAYAATSNYLVSTATGNLHVIAAATTTSINAPTFVTNEPGTVTITVAAGAGVPTPTGTVSLALDNGTPQTATLDANGQASFTVIGPPATTNPHTLTASYAAQGNYAASASSITTNANQSPTSVAITAPPVTYNANGTVSVTVSSPDGTPNGAVSLIVDGDSAHPLSGNLDASGNVSFTLTSPAAGDHTLEADYAAQGNFAGSMADAGLHVNQAPTSVGVNAPTVTYNANGTVTVTVSSGSGTPTGNVSLSVDGNAAVMQALDGNGQSVFTLTSPAAGDHSLHAAYAAQGNFAGSTADGGFHVNQAPTSVSVNAPTVTYNANGTVTITVSSASGTPSGNVSLSVDAGTAITQTLDGNGQSVFTLGSPAAGDHSLHVAYAAQGNFAGSTADMNLHVNPAPTSIGVSAPTVTYNANGTVTITLTSASGTPGGNVSLSVDGGTAVTQALDANGQSVFTLTSPTAGDHSLHTVYAAQGNFAGSIADASLHVNQANANITVNPYSGTYDSLAHGLTGSATGVAGEDLSNLLNLGSADSNAGHYVVDWTFAGDTNYKSASGSSTIDIAKATAGIGVTPYAVTYDSMAHTATATATSVASADLSGDLTLSGTTHTAAGTYSADAWSFHDPNGNYTDASGTVSDSIAKRDLYVTANANSKTYGQAVIDTGTVTGVQGSDGITAAFSSAGDVATAAVGSGSYIITAMLSDPNAALGNYTVHETDATLTVSKANASVAITPYSIVYDGTAHTATGQAMGVFGEDLSSDLTLSGTTHTNAGSYGSDAWSFHDPNGNYNDASGTVADSIAKANATITVTPYSVTYDGNAHTATGSATGVLGESLSGLDLSATSHTNAGSYASDAWTFTDSTGNYNNASGSVKDSIAQAPLSVVADNKTKTYGDTNPTLTGTLTGAVAGDGITASYSTTATQFSDVGSGPNADGSYVIAASLNDPNGRLGNYLVTNTPGALTINKANQTITWSNSASITYGTALSGTQLDATVAGVTGGAAPGALTYNPAAGTVLGPGSGQVLSVTAAATTDYNQATASVTLNVLYHFGGFLAPLNSNMSLALNRTIPIKFQLTDANGNYISSLGAVTSLQVLNSAGTNVLTNAGSTALRYDTTANQFIANWQTKGLAAGTYTVTLVLADGTTDTKTVTLSKAGGSAGLTTVAAGGTSAAAGGLLGGDVELYVDNSNGDLTADELARIQDAVTAADAVTEPYGVKVEEVSDPTLSDVTLNMDTTSAVGGYADGVLGCTTDAGQITLIQGWNFYAGSDATQIGSGQYDFQTVLTHELGHALGLGHSTDSTSVMYATLNTGSVNRSLKAADLNVADSDTTGACGLHAAILDVGRISNPSYEARRDMVFSAVAMQPDGLPLGSRQLLSSSDAPSRSAGMAEWQPNTDLASPAIKNGDPLVAVQTPREADDAPHFPDAGQDGHADATSTDGGAATWIDGNDGFIAADSGWPDD